MNPAFIFVPIALVAMVLGGSRAPKTLTGGVWYRIRANAEGEDDTNWSGFFEQLKKSKGILNPKLEGAGALRFLDYQFRPTSDVVFKPGEPAFQINGVTVTFSKAEKL